MKTNVLALEAKEILIEDTKVIGGWDPSDIVDVVLIDPSDIVDVVLVDRNNSFGSKK